MTPRCELAQRISLNRQVIVILWKTIVQLLEKFFLRVLLKRREKAITDRYDKRLSHEIDAIQFLLEE